MKWLATYDVPTSCLMMIWLVLACNGPITNNKSSSDENENVGSKKTQAKTLDGQYIFWQEHIIDDPKIGGVEISGSDGLTTGDRYHHKISQFATNLFISSEPTQNL